MADAIGSGFAQGFGRAFQIPNLVSNDDQFYMEILGEKLRDKRIEEQRKYEAEMREKMYSNQQNMAKNSAKMRYLTSWVIAHPDASQEEVMNHAKLFDAIYGGDYSSLGKEEEPKETDKQEKRQSTAPIAKLARGVKKYGGVAARQLGYPIAWLFTEEGEPVYGEAGIYGDRDFYKKVKERKPSPEELIWQRSSELGVNPTYGLELRKEFLKSQEK